VLDAGATAAGRPYFVMELVRGIPITDYCDQKSLAPAERLQLFIRVCHAVQHAHHKGIIHRDLKPSNVLVTLHDGEPVPKVIDFGVAKALGQKLTDKTLFTRFAQMLGTPAYMSPEQAELSGLDIDTRSDIYSLGVLLYELLTGVTPFDKETLARVALDEVRRMIRETEPPKPSVRLQTLGDKLTEVAGKRQSEPMALKRLLRGDLDWIVMKCLEKDRQRRYETPGALAQDVERHLHCEPVLASPPSAGYLLAKFVRRNRVSVSFVSMMVLALMIGLWSTLIALKRARQEQLRAEAAATIATTVSDILTVPDNPGQPADTNAPSVSRAMLDQLAGNIKGQFADRPLVEAAVRLALGRTYASLGDYSLAERQVQRAAEIRTKELGPEDPATLEAHGALGFLWLKQGNRAGAESQLRRVLETQRRRLGESDPATIQTLVMLGAVQRPPGEASLTPDLLKAVKSLRNDDPRTLRALHSVVDTLRSEKRLLDAETLGRELLNRWERVHGSNHTETVHGLLCLSYTLQALDRTAECERLRREALRRGRLDNPTGSATVTAFTQLIELIMDRHDYDEAQRLWEEELEIQKRVLGPGHEITLRTGQSLAKVAQLKASYAAEDSQRRDQLAGAEARVRVDPTDGEARLQRALARADLNQWSLALADLNRAMSPTNIPGRTKTANLAVACLRLAERAFSATQLKIAEQALGEAVRLLKRLEQENPKESGHAISLGHSLWQLGDVLLAIGRKEEAKQALDQALRVFEQAVDRWPEEPYLRQEQAFSHRKIGVYYQTAGKEDDAAAHYRTAITLYVTLKQQFPTHAWYAHEEAFTTWYVAESLDKAGRRDAAEAAYRQALSLHEKGVVDFPKTPEFNSRLRSIRLELATLLDAQGKKGEADALRLRQRQEDESYVRSAPEGRPETGVRLPRPAKEIPSRPEQATPEMVDLTSHFHAALTETWHPGAEGNDLAHLPSGVQTFQGVRFDVRGIVQLNGGGMIDMSGKPYPQRVQGIKIGRKCARIHVLHATGWSVDDGTAIGAYVLRYADGSNRTLPILYGLDVRDWWVGADTVVELKKAQVAWQGQTSSGNGVRVYKRTWENPVPDREVVSIEFSSTMTRSAPFLLAITTELAEGDRLPEPNLATVQAMELRGAHTNLDGPLLRQASMEQAQVLPRQGDINAAAEMFRLAELADVKAVRNPRNGHFYKRLTRPMTWPEARDFCTRLGGHLATVTSREENDFLYQNFARDHVCWLGASDEAKEGDWQWVTGEPFVFTNWFRGEPNNDKGKEHFLVMGTQPGIRYNFGASWNDHEVTGTLANGPAMYPICEWDSPPPGMMAMTPVETAANNQPLVVAPPAASPARPKSGSAVRPPKAATGSRAPAAKLDLLDGGQLDLTAHLGTNILLLVFWATWSPDCGTSLPILAGVAEDYRDKSVALYTVNLSESPEKIRGFLQKTRCKVNVALDQDGSVVERYGIEAVPTVILIGKDGRIQALHEQTKPDLKDMLKQELDALLAGRTLAGPMDASARN
jgi:tetratricopeptide (TPR) repeat protein/peroxiredoxin